MEKNEELVGVVSGIGANGEGIIKQDGTVVFVPFTLIGEKVRYKILKVTSKCAYGKVVEVLTPAEMRIRAKCPVFTKCGGCQLQHVKYVNQLKMKEENTIYYDDDDGFEYYNAIDKYKSPMCYIHDNDYDYIFIAKIIESELK